MAHRTRKVQAKQNTSGSFFSAAWEYRSSLSFLVTLLVMGAVIGWAVAGIILVNLAWHEYGHIREARRVGVATGRMLFIPFLGGVAPMLSSFPSRWAEVTVTLAGPFFGFTMALLLLGIGWALDSPWVLVAAGVQALVNLFNLIPLNPLDGGRLLKSLAFSVHYRAGIASLWCTNIMAAVLAIILVRPVFFLVSLAGFGELEEERERAAKCRQERLAAAATLNRLRLCPVERVEQEAATLVPDYPRLSLLQSGLTIGGWLGLTAGLLGILVAAGAHPGVFPLLKELF